MYKFLIIFFVPFLLSAIPRNINEYEKKIIEHVQFSIDEAEKGNSKLTQEILEMEGMSSFKIRHFMNNLCSLPNTNYLEIGCYKGSTWVSSLFKNQDNIKHAYAIDNWSEFGSQKNIFIENNQKFISSHAYNKSIISCDSFSLDVSSVINTPIKIYFYDGNHSRISQELAFTYYNNVLDDVFIAIVDDWNWIDVQEGTKAAFKKLGYEVLFERIMSSRFCGDLETWWNGFYIAVIRKSKK